MARRPDLRSVRLTLTTQDLAQLFDVTPETIRRWIRERKLPLTGEAITDFNTLRSLLGSRPITL